MLELFSKENPEVDINIITPNERYMQEFLSWFVESEFDKRFVED